MIIIKYISTFLIFIICSAIGILYSKKYSNRVKELEEIKNALNIFKSKIKFTYEPIPEVFKQISTQLHSNIGTIFLKASNYMKNDIAGEAWEKSIDEEKNNINLTNDDTEIIKKLSKMLGNTDLDGQLNNIELINRFLDKQIVEAEREEEKNEKLYKTLGASIGLTIAIILF